MNTTTPPYTRKPSIGAPDVEICDPAIGAYRDPHVCYVCGRPDPEHRWREFLEHSEVPSVDETMWLHGYLAQRTVTTRMATIPPIINWFTGQVLDEDGADIEGFYDIALP